MNDRMEMALAGVVAENIALRAERDVLLAKNAGLLEDAEALNDEIDRLRGKGGANSQFEASGVSGGIKTPSRT